MAHELIALRREQLRNDPGYREKLGRLRSDWAAGRLEADSLDPESMERFRRSLPGS